MPTDPAEVTVRLARPDEWAVLADLYSEVRRDAVPQMPPAVHSDEEHREFYRRHLLADDQHTVWVAESAGEPVGVAVCTPTFLDGLYVRADRAGQGIGSMLLDVVEATHPEGFELWVFQSNTVAQRLYERRGMVVVERTDGADNEERSPDLRMAWQPSSTT